CRFARSALIEQQLHVEVDRVQRVAARRAVRARDLGPVREKGMQRAEADERRSLPRGDLDQAPQVAEIADAPVVRRTQRIELHGATPPAFARFQCRRHPAALGRDDDEAMALLLAGDGEMPIATLEVRRQVDAVVVAGTGDFALAYAR